MVNLPIAAGTLLRALFLAAVLFLIAAWPAPAEAAACPCSLPPNQTCPAACSSCVLQQFSCTCDTGCVSSGCPSGYQTISSSVCFPNVFLNDNVCRRSGLVQTSQCAGCAPGRYGANCDACPGGATNPCNGHGICDQGIFGSGVCACAPGYAGFACQYSDAVTCNGHGTVNAAGACTCAPGYTGPTCNVCAPNYFGYPNCTFCSAPVTCNGHGSCGATGDCVCETGYTGPGCSSCAVSYYGYPDCRFCDADTTCGGRGVCDALGFCVCDEVYSGAGCDTCAVDHYDFPACTYCDSLATCTGHGACDPTTGACICDQGFEGPNCVDCDATSVELVCGDGIDEDCDNAPDCVDTDCCTAGACAAGDTDGDSYVSCDCDPADPGAWTIPSEVIGLMLTHSTVSATTTLTWPVAAEPGGAPAVYKTLRFDDPRDFDQATTCLPATDPSRTKSTDTTDPGVGEGFFYLIRARSACPGGDGPLGTDSAGDPRTATCP